MMVSKIIATLAVLVAVAPQVFGLNVLPASRASDRNQFEAMACDDSGQVYTVSGGLTGSVLITEVTASTSAWVAAPTTALTNRRVLAIRNDHATIDVKLNADNTESGYVGMTLEPGDVRSYPLSSSETLYVKSESGTPTITVEEIANL